MSVAHRRSHRSSTRTRARLLLTGMVFAFLFLAGTAPAPAAQGAVTLQQHFELLSETSLGNVADTTLFAARGTLSGGTAVFDPAPTVSLEVVGRHTGGNGSGGTWTVTLKDSDGSTIAAVAFPKDAAYQLRTATFTWPTVDRDLDTVVLTRADAGTSVAGTFDITKAYLKIHQSGLTKKTVGRVPMGTKQVGVSSPSGTRLEGPALFTFDADVYSPAPVVRLRAAAQGSPCMEIYLQDDTAGTMVADSLMRFNDYASTRTSPLALLDEHTYVLHARFSADTACIPPITQNQSNSTNVPAASPPGTGDIFSADLTFEQSTTEPNGLTKTVAFFPSVTAATDIQNVSALNFMLKAPQTVVPNPIAATWSYTAKRTSVPTVGGSIGADPVNRTTGSTLVDAPDVGDTSSAFVRRFATVATLPSYGSDLDTQSYVDNTTSTRGRISASMLALALNLRDIDAPTIAGPSITNAKFSPNSTDVALRTTTVLATLADFSSVSWYVEIKTAASGTLVRTSPTYATTAVSWAWNGNNDAGSPLGDDNYTATIKATDGAGNLRVAPSLAITLDKTPPAIANFNLSRSVINPSAANSALRTSTISAGLADPTTPIYWTVAITNSVGDPVKSYTGAGTTVSANWDGKTGSDVVVADGLYTVTLSAADGLSNFSVQTGSIRVDKTAPTITNYTASTTPFSPDGNGTKDTTTFSATLADATSPIDWSIAITNSGGTLKRTLSGQGTSISAPWNGQDSQGVVVAWGTYTATLTATDIVANAQVLARTVVVDLSAPSVTGLSASKTAFNPARDTTILTASTQDASTISTCRFDIKNGSGTIKRTLGPGSCSPTWDGKDGTGVVVADGPYRVDVVAKDSQDLTSPVFAFFNVTTIDTLSPIISGLGASTSPATNPVGFSPNGDGHLDLATFAGSFSEQSSWVLTIGGGPSFGGSGTSFSQAWNGIGSNEGAYNATLTATDAVGNATTSPSISVIIDKTAPSVTNYQASITPFSPDGNGTMDTTTLSAGLADATTPITWDIAITSSSGALKRSFNGTGTSINEPWNGQDSQGGVVAPGTYTATLTATDPITNARVLSRSIVVDLAAPTVTDLSASKTTFNPSRDTTTLTATAQDASSVSSCRFDIRNSSGAIKRTLEPGSCSAAWDGKDSIGLALPDDSYSVDVVAKDSQELTSQAFSFPDVTAIDTVGPIISGFAATTSPATSPVGFSPNNDGYADSITFGGSFSEQSSWVLAIGGGPTFTGSGSPFSQPWTGAGAGEGTYSVTVAATDLAGNPTTSSAISVILDKTAPTITNYEIKAKACPTCALAVTTAFSPNGDGAKDTLEISASLTDTWMPISWTIQIKKGAGPTIRGFDGVGNLSAIWDGKDGAGASVPDGRYSALLTAFDVGRNPRSASLEIIVDVTPPSVAVFLPEDRGNTVYVQQRLGAQIAEQGSGVSGTPTLTLSDVTTSGAALPIPASFDAGSGWLRSGTPVALTLGHDYEAEVTAQDAAGNEMSSAWPLRAISPPVFGQGDASMDDDGTNTGVPGTTPGTVIWRFTPYLHLGVREVTFAQGSAHSGWGTAGSTASLGTARVRVTTAGQQTDWPIAPYASNATRTVYEQLPYIDPDGDAMSMAVGPTEVGLPQLDVELPSTVTAATLHLEQGPLTSTAAGLCADPPSSADGCSTDPIRFYMASSLALKIRDVQTGDLPPGGTDPIGAGGDVIKVSQLLLDPLSPESGSWSQYQPLENTACIDDPFTGDRVCPIDGVLYPADSAVVPPSRFLEFCSKTNFCNTRRMTTSAVGVQFLSDKVHCIDLFDGRDRPGTCSYAGCYGQGSERCQQVFWVQGAQLRTFTGAVSGKKIHTFQAWTASDWGFEDGIYDSLGLEYSTPTQNMHWALANEEDLPDYSNGYPAFASYDGYPYSLYPQNGYQQPSYEAADVWQECFAIPGHGQIIAAERDATSLKDPSKPHDAETNPHVYVYGAGTGVDGTGGLPGWKQRQEIPSCPNSADQTAYMRADTASLVAHAYQLNTCGPACGARADGYLLATYGHSKTTVNWAQSAWSFAISAGKACFGRRKALCNPWGLALTAAKSVKQEERMEYTRGAYPRAFSYS